MAMPGESSGLNQLPVVKACDACRQRKIRCDKKAPCSSCRTLEITCRRTPKVNEQRHHRVLISHEYERKVDRIDERLHSIDQSLQKLVEASQNQTLQPAYQARPFSETLRVANLAGSSIDRNATLKTPEKLGVGSNAEFEGDTSLMAHSLQAKALFEMEVSSRTALGSSPRMKNALSALQATLQSQNSASEFHNLRFPHLSQDVAGGGLKPEMPPLDVVLEILSCIKKQIPRCFLEFPLLELSNFQELCQKVYFAVDEYPPAVFTIVNAGLSRLFVEFGLSASPDVAIEYERYASICRSNFEGNLQSFQLLATPSLENCQALVFGAIHAIDISKPSVAVRLTSAAVQMCQSLGYHRIPDSQSAFAQKRIFWTAYVLEKTVSLRVGRTSTLQDCDISTRKLDCPADPLQIPWHMMHLAWISLARLQAQVYQHLYTVHAMAAPLDIRIKRAEMLVVELDRWRQECSVMQTEDAYYPAAFRTSFETVDIAYYATLTTIQRVLPPDSFDMQSIINEQCLESARAALKTHQLLALRYKHSDEWQYYVTWTLIFSPFSPILVLFCHTINARSTIDLAQLCAFVDSLKPIGTPPDSSTTSYTIATQRLHDLCAAFCNVAEVYLSESESVVAGDEALTAGGNFQPDLLGQLDDVLFWPMEDLFTGDQNMGRFFEL